MQILMVVTSHAEMGDTGQKTGIWLEEFTTPYYTFINAGAKVTVASPKGGRPPIDPNSEAEEAQTESTKRFEDDAAAQTTFSGSLILENVKAADYDAVFYPGGHGPLWDLVSDKNSIALIQSFYSQDKPVGAVCHGPAAFLNVVTLEGSLINGKNVTGFTNEEEDAVGLTKTVPFLLEDELKAKGGKFSKANKFKPYSVTDGLLITGQNPQSSEMVANALLALIKK